MDCLSIEGVIECVEKQKQVYCLYNFFQESFLTFQTLKELKEYLKMYGINSFIRKHHMIINKDLIISDETWSFLQKFYGDVAKLIKYKEFYYTEGEFRKICRRSYLTGDLRVDPNYSDLPFLVDLMKAEFLQNI
jgi:hypothetical protein